VAIGRERELADRRIKVDVGEIEMVLQPNCASRASMFFSARMAR